MNVPHTTTAAALVRLLEAHPSEVLTGLEGSLRPAVLSDPLWQTAKDGAERIIWRGASSRYVLRLDDPTKGARSAWEAYIDTMTGRALYPDKPPEGGASPGKPDAASGVAVLDAPAQTIDAAFTKVASAVAAPSTHASTFALVLLVLAGAVLVLAAASR